MPNRILKESICTSESIDSLTAYQEVFFYRLLVNCDDYGRMDGRPRVISSKLFPLCDYNENLIEQTLSVLADRDFIMLYTVDSRRYIQVKAWDKHQQVRARKSKYPSPNDINDQDNADFCNQMISDDIKCPRNPIQSESESESQSVSVSEPGLMPECEAQATQADHDIILEAAKNAGFQISPVVMARLIRLYVENSLDKMLHAIDECAKHGVTNLAYLEAVLKGKPKKEKPRVAAQDYEQRDYSEIQNTIEQQQRQRFAERLAARRENQT